MATKRVHKIAKEHGLTALELLVQLRDAGFDVTAAAQEVDEDEVIEKLGLNGAQIVEQPFSPTPKPVEQPEPAPAPVVDAPPAAPAAPPIEPQIQIPSPVSTPAPEPVQSAPAAPATPPAAAPKAPAPASGPRIIAQPEPAPAKPKPRRQEAAAPARPVKPAPRPAKPAPLAPAPSRPAPTLQPPPDPREIAARILAEEAAAKAAAEAEAAAKAAAGTDAEAAPAAPEAKEADKKDDGKPQLTIGDKPDAGRGPKILAVPEPPKRPKRDESQNLPGGRKGAPTTGAAGRRRVVIDSQAARRGPGGPGGPGGPVNQPPRRQRRGRRRRGTYNDSVNELDVSAQTSIDLIKINSGSTVKEVAEYLGVPVPDVIRKLMGLGEMATVTQTLSDDAIQVIAEEFEREIEIVHASDDEDVIEYEDDEADLVTRPPVVTIMGHVDHGKTSLLDAVRQADVVGGESGGITQHIGAYQVHHNDKIITFLDTPGHEAFTAMRARGARVTDIAVIVVAADDGVMPQTEEAIDHAKAADVPIVVAVNKIDKEGADPTRVRTEMTTRELQPSEWGGDTEYVDVSAKAKLNLDDLLDTILVVAELEDLKANPDAEASGVVVESKLDPGRGPVVTVLIQRGTLRVGDALLAGPQWGKVRAMHDYTGARIKQAVPGDPVEILGFDGVPDAGETVRVVENDKQARSLAAERGHRLKTESLARRSGRKVSLDDVFKRVLGSEYKELNLIVKVDVAGSLEAIEDEIAKLPQQEVQVNIIHSGVGGITESDVMLATASDAAIMGFNVRPVGDARAAADREGVEILNYSVIYKAMDDLRDAMEGMLDPEEVEDAVGEVEVRQIFRASKIGLIAGCMVTSGKVTRGARLRVVRDGRVVTESKIDSLKRFNEDVREVAAGFECGITLAGTQDIQEGDVFEVFATRKVDRVLAR